MRLFQDALYEEISAVATLMYHCGASVEMDYAPGGSGASSQQIPLSLHEYFGYSVSGIYKNKDDYTEQEWITMLIEELMLFDHFITVAETVKDRGHILIITFNLVVKPNQMQ